jgi:hypothetical protein
VFWASSGSTSISYPLYLEGYPLSCTPHALIELQKEQKRVGISI